MNINDMTNKDIAILMAGRYVGENNCNEIDIRYAFHANEITFQILGDQILSSKQAYTALIGLCIDGYCKKIGPGQFVFTEDGIARYEYLESVFGEEYDDDDIKDDDSDDEVNAEPAWKTAYDAAMQAYDAAMNAYHAAMGA